MNVTSKILLAFACLGLAACGAGGGNSSSTPIDSPSSSKTEETSSKDEVSSESVTETSDTASEDPLPSSEESTISSQESSEPEPEPDPVDPTTVFDENDILLSFPVITDIHVGYSDANVNYAERLTDTFAALKSFRPDTTFDLVMSAGDQTQNGKAADVQALMEKYNAAFDLSKTPFFFSHGNHDTHWAGCMDTYGFYNAYGSDVYQFDLDQAAAKLGNRHMVRKGVHFISLEFTSYGPGLNTFPDRTVTWLQQTLASAYADTPDMPIFVVGHSPVHSTIPGSFSSDNSGDWGATKMLLPILKDYHNVIYFSGHTHYNIHDDRAIHQDDITEVQAACTSDIELDTNLPGVSQLSNRREYSFGEICEVDSRGNVRIGRYDLNERAQVMDYWEISRPQEDLSHLNRYSDAARAAKQDTPRLKEGGKFILLHTSDGKITITFDAFETDTYMIFSYKARIFPMSQEEIVDENEDYIIDIPWLDDWYNSPAKKTGTISMPLTGTYSRKSTWTVKLYAYDCVGNVGFAWPTRIMLL